MLLSPTFLLFDGGASLPNKNQEATTLQTTRGLKIEMVPSGWKGDRQAKPLKLGSKVYLRIIVRNDTDQRVRVTVVDTYYQNRPQLFKDGRLIAYREEVKRLIHSKDNEPEFVRPGSVVFLEPYASTDLEELSLSDWYGELQPGSYRLINRHRFDIDGPWTSNSAELLFEVVPTE